MGEEKYIFPDEIYDKIPLDEIKYIVEQGEIALSSSRDSDNRVTSRSLTLFSFIGAIILGLVGYFFSAMSNEVPLDSANIIITIVSIVYLFIVILYMYRNIKSLGLLKEGIEPRQLLNTTFMGKGILFYYQTQAQNIQRALDKNSKKVNEKWKRLDKSINAIIAMPIAICIIYLILLFSS